MMSLRGQASWANMTSPGEKLTALVCHPSKKVSKAEELTYLSPNIGANINCQSIACTRSFDKGLTSAEGQKLEYFKLAANNIL